MLTDRQNKLFDWVKEQHGDQTRKYSHEPYWNHLIRVAEIVHRYDNFPGLTEIALCHDLLEDVDNIDSDDLEDYLFECGYSDSERDFIIDNVADLTDEYTSKNYPNWNREKRVRYENRRLRMTSQYAQTVKYGDIIDNVNNIVAYDPGFALTYVPEKIDLLSCIRMGNVDLLIECGYVLYNAKQDLKIL